MEKVAVKDRVLITGMLAVALTSAAGLILSLIIVGCTTVERSMLRERQCRYDLNHGVGAEDIRQHFNLHRGRPWNYYCRGIVYLELGHHEEALSDFEVAIATRERDQRDSRMYGMHFIDYFPHRESGVAHYLRGEFAEDDARKELYCREALRELETSLSHEESARAKFYLNRAKTSLWQVTKADTTPPTIHMERQIYTNQRKVSFAVTAMDHESHVGEIRISGANVRIDSPNLFIELAEQVVTRKAELSVGSRETAAIVAITASDLAGNVSDPYSALIIVDTEAPTAAIAIAGKEARRDGQLEVSIRARDNSGLRRIQVGEEPNEKKVDCDGASEYSVSIAGVPKEDELVITVVDIAGNAVVAGIPVEELPTRARSVGAPRSGTPWMYALARGAAASNWSRPIPLILLPKRDVPPPGRAMFFHQSGHAQITSLAGWEEPRDDETKPKLHFSNDVNQPPPEGKETSMDSFNVTGMLLYGSDVNDIRVDRQEVVSWEAPRRHYEETTFQHDVNLADIPFDQTISIEVEAYCKDDPNTPCAHETLTVTRVDDGSLDVDAVYGLLVLPMPVIPKGGVDTSSIRGWEESTPSRIYNLFVEKLRALRMSDRIPLDLLDRCGQKDKGVSPECRKSSRGFRVYDVNQVYRVLNAQAWYELDKNRRSVVENLQDWRKGKRRTGAISINPQEGVDPCHIDLVVDGIVRVDNSEGLDIWFSVVAVSDGAEFRFPDPGIYFTIPDLPDGIKHLAEKIADRFPRVWTDDVQLDKNDERCLIIDRGTNDGLFQKMELWLYTVDTEINPKFTKHVREDISNVEPFRSWIECKDADASSQPEDYVVITK